MLSPDDKILAIDIGGSHIKATLLDASGKMLNDYEKLDTPDPADPEHVLDTIAQLAQNLEGYTKISAGFPGLVRKGIVLTAPNLGSESWKAVPLAQMLTDKLHCSARVVNDADMQGLGVVSGKGLEMMITLGTGFGTAFLLNGKLLPHFEIAHHPVRKGRDYDAFIGDKALKKIGKQKWNKRMEEVLAIVKTVFNYDGLYIGGGNARYLTVQPDENIKLVSNEDGIHGGAKLWDDTAAGFFE